MIGTHIQKILGDLTARRGRTVWVVMAIFIGVAGTVSLFSMRNILIDELNKNIKTNEISMLDVNVTVEPDARLDNTAYLQALATSPDVTEVVGYVNARARFKLHEEDDTFIDGFIEAYSTPFRHGVPIEPPRLQSGRFPADGAGEIVIDQRMATKYDLAIGDSIYVQVLSSSNNAALDGAVGTIETRTITGIVFDPYQTPIGQEGAEVHVTPEESFFSTLEDAGYIAGIPGYTAFRVRFEDFATAEQQAETLVQYIRNETPYHVGESETIDPANNHYGGNTRTFTSTLSTVALVALVVSGFLVTNVIGSIVVEQKRQIGALKALGASQWDNLSIFMGIALAYGLLGVIPGVLVGIPVGSLVANQLSPELARTELAGFHISYSAILLGAGIGLLVPASAAIPPVLRGTRVSILETMTDVGIDTNYGTGITARLLARLPLPITIRQGLSNVSMKKARLAFTILTLTVAAGVSMGIYGLFARIAAGLDDMERTNASHINLFPSSSLPPEAIIPVLQTHFENKLVAIEPGFTVPVTIDGYQPAVLMGESEGGIETSGYAWESPTPPFDFSLTEGQLLTAETAENGVILASNLASNLGKSVGDTIVIHVSDRTAELTITGITNYPIERMWVDWRTLARLAGHTQGAPVPNQYVSQVVLGHQSGEPVTIMGIDNQIADALTILDGTFVTPDQPGIIVSDVLATHKGYQVGDTVTLTASAPNGASADYPIVGIVALPSDVGDEELPAEIIGMYWRALATLEGIDLSGEPVPQVYLLTTTLSAPTVGELDAMMKDMQNVMADNGVPVITSSTIEEFQEIRQMFLAIQIILQVAAGLIALIGALGLLTTLSMSVFERQKEIGVMRAVGARSKTIATQFLTEGLTVGIMAWGLGLPLAIGIYYLLIDVTGFSGTITMGLPYTAVLIGLAGMLVVVTLASLFPSISAARRTVADIIRYQ